jgi:Raf kinase inhibitor-like YbhB/YbcL family protein
MWRFGVLITLLALAACGGGDTVKGPPPQAPASIKLTSSFAPGAVIPRQNTCDGKNVSPLLAWSGVPAGAQSLALLVEDPDAPGGTFVHWTAYDIPPKTTRFDENSIPPGTMQGENSFGNRKYAGPCPPKGDQPHRYVFTLYALKSSPGLGSGAKPDDVRTAIKGRALAKGQLVGRFGR